MLRSFWIRSWSEDKDVHTAQDITAVGRSAGMDEEEISNCLAAMKTDPVKTALKVGIDDEISIHDMFTVMLNSTAFTKAVTEEAVEKELLVLPPCFFIKMEKMSKCSGGQTGLRWWLVFITRNGLDLILANKY